MPIWTFREYEEGLIKLATMRDESARRRVSAATHIRTKILPSGTLSPEPVRYRIIHRYKYHFLCEYKGIRRSFLYHDVTANQVLPVSVRTDNKEDKSR